MFAQLAPRETTPEPITDAVGVGPTQSFPDCASSLASDVPTAASSAALSQKRHINAKLRAIPRV
jgi:hypothetical protein